MDYDFNMTAVESSNIANIGYHVGSNTLRVEFNSGAVYDYHGVSPQQYEALMSSESKGQYLNMAIKPVFAFTKAN